MTDPVTQDPVVLRRVQLSTAAWQLLCESTNTILDLPATDPVSTTTAPDGGHGQSAPLSGDAEEAAWSELKELGMSASAGEVALQWTGAVALLLTAPITVTARATYNDVSTTSVLGLRAGRGLAVHQRHMSERRGPDTVLVGSEDSMEVTLFDMENVWGATARLLPPLDVVQAAAAATTGKPLHAEPAAVLDAGNDPAALAAALAELVSDEDANVTLSVVSAAEGHPSRDWVGKWSVKGNRLYSLTTSGGDVPEIHLAEVPAGNIAHELVLAVVSAQRELDKAERAEKAEKVSAETAANAASNGHSSGDSSGTARDSSPTG